MAPHVVHVCVEQEEAIELPLDASPEVAAEALMRALRAPLRLSWHVELASGAVVELSGGLSHGAHEWPPREIRLRVEPPRNAGAADRKAADGKSGEGGDADGTTTAVEIEVPLGALCEKTLGVVAAAGVTLHGASAPAPGPIERPQRHDAQEQLFLDADPERAIVQPRCLPQWHPGACGHCALFNVRCLLQRFCGPDCCGPEVGSCHDAREQPDLLEEPSFWRRVLVDVRVLADLGQRLGRWPRSRVTGGVLDEIHISELVKADPFLSHNVSILSSPEALGPEARAALAAVAAGRKPAHGFILACSIHWMGLVATGTGHHRIWLCDSFNRPLARLRTPAEVPELAAQHDGEQREATLEKLRSCSEWKHRPEEHLQTVLQEGAPEWWKGKHRASIFWRHQPEQVRIALRGQELSALQRYLEFFAAELAPERRQGATGTPPVELSKGTALRVLAEGFVVVAPHTSRGWRPAAVSKMVDCLLAPSTALNLDGQRLYVTGHSMGGAGALAAAADTRRFAAAVPVAPAGSPDAESLAGVPVWAFHGSNDIIVPSDVSEMLVEDLRTRGATEADARLTLYPEAPAPVGWPMYFGHASTIPAYATPELYSWLLERTLRTERGAPRRELGVGPG